MKKSLRIVSILTLIFILMSALCINTSAAVSAPSIRNTGTRNELCTDLSDKATGYYTEDYTFDALSEKSSSELLTSLRTFMTSTHKGKASYNNCRDYAYYTDCQKGDPENATLLLYSSYTATSNQWASDGSNGWNREHVWPKSLGGFENNDTPGCDLHHVRPADAKINSTRNNNKYGTVTNGKDVTGVITTLSGGYYANSLYEPLDNVKGDVARICLYVYVRYGGEYAKCSNITNVFESVDVLLEWCELDPVDTWEMSRNDVVQSVQGNRNVFIDYPEYAWLLFNEEMPNDIETPSGEAKDYKPIEDLPTDPNPKPEDPKPEDPKPEDPKDPETKDPASNTEKNENATPEKPINEIGCGSSIAISSVCFVGVIGLVAFSKKKED
jgi:endonuclease I